MNTFNKENLIFATFGILLGFIAGYLMHEVLVARQPARFLPGSAIPEGGQTAGATPGGGAPQGGSQANATPPIQEIQQLRSHLEQNPEDADAVRRLGDVSFEMASALQGDPQAGAFWDEARRSYTRYLELRPSGAERADVLSDLGVTYRGLQQFDQALEQFDKAVQVNPNHWQSLFNKVVVLAFDQKNYDAAEPVLNELKRMQPDNPRVAELAAEVDRQRNAA